MEKQPVCPVCQSKKSHPLFQKHQRSYFLCQNCDLKYVFPFPTAQEIRQFYQPDYWRQKSFRGQKISGYVSYLKEKDSFLTYFQGILAQSERFNLSGRVLDVGCGYGFFLEVAQNAGWKIYGLDLSTEPIRQAKKQLGVKTIYNKPLERAGFRPNYFALVTSFHTIEHMTQPARFLKEAGRVLKPGGLVLLTTPNASGWQSRLMRKSWFSYRHPDHLLFFNFRNLALLLKKAGFVKIKKLKAPARLYSLSYLLEISQCYHRVKLLTKLTKLVKKTIGPLGKVGISIPSGDLLVVAEKK